ncbi:TPA: hypothetical protein DEF17_08540 [bacterium]|nr:MAG: hypothetical protein AUJ18_01930 [Candidatus Hydrogenedentes bacterium CG1_02_42_14]PIU47011.1 MAG: hypothetical protein COS94_08625 [Candidatus Hydrogenedentes bacterium CG07_land_8_20_14_0_80_42_17]HBW47956.1 hypothetical protein [bacterium]
MCVDKVEIFFRDEERASGVVIGKEIGRIPWTAVKGLTETWFIVLHGKVEIDDSDLECRFLEAIENYLTLSKAA